MYAPANGVELYYDVVGEGRPLLLMHGGLGFDHAYLRPWHDPLAARHQLIYYDHSGNGRSPRPHGFAGVTHATWADEADALRAHLGHERVVLLGHSYGGFLALEYALRHGEHLAGLILSCTAPALDNPEAIVANAQRKGTPEIVETVMSGLGQPVADDAAFRELLGVIFPLYFKTWRPEEAASIDARSIYSAAAYNHAFTSCVPSYNVADRLPEIATPTLILAGRDDWICPPEQSERMHAGLPNSRLVIFEESGHFPMIEEPEIWLAAVSEWLDALPEE